MKPQLSDEQFARIVTNVTQPMLGMKFAVAPSREITTALCWRVAFLEIGDRSMTVALSSDQRGCTALGAALFACAAEAVDSSIMNDSLAELVNMTAGQIKGAMMLDHALGLPRVQEGSERLNGTPGWRTVRLRAESSVELLVWITDNLAKNQNHGAGK
jgi:hypothetical protein